MPSVIQIFGSSSLGNAKKENTALRMRMAAMKKSPPIVGVPSLDLCHLGPISSIGCPIFRLISAGMNFFDKSAVIRKDAITDKMKLKSIGFLR